MHENTANSGVVRGIFSWTLMLHMHAGVGSVVKLTSKLTSHPSTDIISSIESLLLKSHRRKYACQSSSNTSYPTKRLSGTTSFRCSHGLRSTTFTRSIATRIIPKL